MDTEDLRNKISYMPTAKELYKEFLVILEEIEDSLLNESCDKTLMKIRQKENLYNMLFIKED